jgi:hypothetical protein
MITVSRREFLIWRGRYREIGRKIEGRDIKIEKKRDRANNKNPQQSRVAQLVNYKYLQAVGE